MVESALILRSLESGTPVAEIAAGLVSRILCDEA